MIFELQDAPQIGPYLEEVFEILTAFKEDTGIHVERVVFAPFDVGHQLGIGITASKGGAPTRQGVRVIHDGQIQSLPLFDAVSRALEAIQARYESQEVPDVHL